VNHALLRRFVPSRERFVERRLSRFGVLAGDRLFDVARDRANSAAHFKILLLMPIRLPVRFERRGVPASL